MIKCGLNDFLPGTGHAHGKGWQAHAEPPPRHLCWLQPLLLAHPKARGGGGSAIVPRAPSVPPRDGGSAEPGMELVGKGRTTKPRVEMPEKGEISALPCAGAAHGQWG